MAAAHGEYLARAQPYFKILSLISSQRSNKDRWLHAAHDFTELLLHNIFGAFALGYVTVGMGNLVSSAAAAKKLDFVNVNTGKAATEKEIQTAFEAVSKMAKNHTPSHYKQKPSIELKKQAIKELAIKRLKEEFIPGLQRAFDGFDSYPASAKQALIDMAYNLGLGGLKKFKNLIAAAKKGDRQKVANESNRTSCRKERNDWTKERFEKAVQN